MNNQTTKYVARPPTSIGDKEQLAGVDDRNAFWKDLIPVFKQHGDEAGMQAWRDKVGKAIRERVKKGRLTLLYPLPAAKRKRKPAQASAAHH